MFSMVDLCKLVVAAISKYDYQARVTSFPSEARRDINSQWFGGFLL